MQDLNFPAISAGILGLASPRSTLNSQFFLWFWSHHKIDDSFPCSIHFPQRIPRLGYFEELTENETPFFREVFLNLQAKLTHTLEAHLESSPETWRGDKAKTLSVHLDLGLRLGVFASFGIRSAREISSKTVHDESFPCLLRLISADINAAISRDETIDLSDLKKLIEIAATSGSVSELNVSLAVNRLLVTMARYKPHEILEAIPEAVFTRTFEFVENQKPRSLEDHLTTSMIWRGLSMWPNLTSQEVDSYLDRSIELARLAPESQPQGRILKNEMIYTLLLTFQKRAFQKKDTASAISALTQAIEEIDPQDSTAISELALMHFKAAQYSQAQPLFKKAIELGPPALGLNAYFAGLSAQKLGDTAEAEKWLRKAIRFDRFAVSPWVDLLKIYRKENQSGKAQEVIAHLRANLDLLEQLTFEERAALEI